VVFVIPAEAGIERRLSFPRKRESSGARKPQRLKTQ
jgi:hypothetical protein